MVVMNTTVCDSRTSYDGAVDNPPYHFSIVCHSPGRRKVGPSPIRACRCGRRGPQRASSPTSQENPRNKTHLIGYPVVAALALGVGAMGSSAQPAQTPAAATAVAATSVVTAESSTAPGILATNNSVGKSVVAIKASDKCFQSAGCADWVKR